MNTILKHAPISAQIRQSSSLCRVYIREKFLWHRQKRIILVRMWNSDSASHLTCSSQIRVLSGRLLRFRLFDVREKTFNLFHSQSNYSLFSGFLDGILHLGPSCFLVLLGLEQLDLQLFFLFFHWCTIREAFFRSFRSILLCLVEEKRICQVF